ncbi:hypothetical protein O1611_g922 [Lasiodiplodia mahajangana]|uniref:Uncharacterized protein n=1 Tax=Lasiodiplodia mahajangana TaxID=1108764 RepID=A0ACC2JZK8_9PEZI|nr:hypothetical protein O1611_g922 [Lasiodiplodia mahajangana]
MDSLLSPPSSRETISSPSPLILPLTSAPTTAIHPAVARGYLRSHTVPIPQTRDEALTSSLKSRNSISVDRKAETPTVQQLVAEAITELGTIQRDVKKTHSLMERIRYRDEELVRSSLASLTRSVDESQAVLLQWKAGATRVNGTVETIRELLDSFNSVMRGGGSHRAQVSKYPKGLPWIQDSQRGQQEIMQEHLCAFETRIEKTEKWFKLFVVAFLEAHVREMEIELFKYRATSNQNHLTEAPHLTGKLDILSKPHIHERIRHLSECVRPSWRQYKDVPGAYLRRYEFYKRAQHHSAGKWLFHTPAFTSWLQDSSRNLLWCRGEPGVGKSFLASRVIDSLRRNGYHHAYFHLGTGKVQSASGVILALLEQLCAQTGTVPSSLELSTQATQYDALEGSKKVQAFDSASSEDPTEPTPNLPRRHDNSNRGHNPCHTPPSLDTLIAALCDTCSSRTFRPSQLFIVLDGWDEDNMDVAEEFQLTLAALISCSCKLYISSRPNQGFEDVPVNVIDLEDGNWLDMIKYTEEKLRVGLYSLPYKAIIDAGREVFRPSSNIFNVTNIMVQTVLRASDPQGYIDKLKHYHISDLLPQDIGVQLLNPQNQLIDVSRVSKVIILYLLESDCPLSFDALGALLPAILKFMYPSNHDFNGRDLENTLRNCEPFVTIDPGNQVVGLNVAISNRSEIIEFWRAEVPKMYLAIIKSHLKLISKKKPPAGLYDVESELADLFRRQPELEHAVTWPNYVQRLIHLGGVERDSGKEAIDKLFQNEEGLSSTLQMYLFVRGEHCQYGMTWDVFNTWIKSMSKLQMIARWGFTWAAQKILSETPEAVSKSDSRSSTALHEAAKGGFMDITKLLLEKNARADCIDVEGKTPSVYAFEKGHLSLFIQLFNAQVAVSPKPQVERISDEITLAYCRARNKVHGNSPERSKELTVLQIISEDDDQQAAVISFLLVTGTDPDCTNDQGEPALYLAIKHNKRRVLTALLDQGADPSKKTGSGLRESPLHLAVRLGLTYIIELLLEAGADVNSLDCTGRTPLFTTLDCEKEGEIEGMMGKLVAHGANVDHADSQGRRPLHVAAEKGLVTPLLLFRFWAKDKNPRDNEGCTLLDHAKRYGSIEVQWLLGE